MRRAEVCSGEESRGGEQQEKANSICVLDRESCERENQEREREGVVETIERVVIEIRDKNVSKG